MAFPRTQTQTEAILLKAERLENADAANMFLLSYLDSGIYKWDTKTLAQIQALLQVSWLLSGVYYDGTLGDTGADYTSITAAQTAGKKRLKLVSNLTMVANVAINSTIEIDLNGYSLLCGSYTFTYTSGSLKIKRGTTDLSVAGNLNYANFENVIFTVTEANFTGNNMKFINCTFETDSVITGNLNNIYNCNIKDGLFVNGNNNNIESSYFNTTALTFMSGTSYNKATNNQQVSIYNEGNITNTFINN